MSVAGVPLFVFALVGYYHEDPGDEEQEHGDVAIVDEETGLACPLEPPVH